MNAVGDNIEPCPTCRVILTRNTEGHPFKSICPTVIEQPTADSRKWRVHCYCCGSRTIWTSRSDAIDLWNGGIKLPPKTVRRKTWGKAYDDRKETV